MADEKKIMTPTQAVRWATTRIRSRSDPAGPVVFEDLSLFEKYGDFQPGTHPGTRVHDKGSAITDTSVCHEQRNTKVHNVEAVK